MGHFPLQNSFFIIFFSSSECSYELFCTPSVSSGSTPVTIPSSQTPTSPLSTSISPTHTPFTPSHTPNSPPSDPLNSPVPTSSNVTFNLSPPPPPVNRLPPICVDPSEVRRYRTPAFSPTSTCLSMSSFAVQRLNQSTELFSTLPRVSSSGLQRHSSLSFKNRTLPPLPTTRPGDSFRLLPAAMAKSQPQLDDHNGDLSDDEPEGSRPIRLHRKLSNSMDCINSSSTINEYPDGDSIFDIEASPYLQPVQVQMALGRHSTLNAPTASTATTASEKVPKQRPYPSLPDGFLTLRRNHPLEKSHSFREKPSKHQSGSIPRLSEQPGTHTCTCTIIYCFVFVGFYNVVY